MSGWDVGNVYVSSNTGVTSALGRNQKTGSQIIGKLGEFIRNFKDKNSFTYRDQLRQNCLMKKYSLELSLDDLSGFDNELYDLLVAKPSEVIPLFAAGAKEVAKDIVPDKDRIDDEPLLDIQITLTSSQNPISIRALVSSQISKLVCISGIIIAASKKQAKATEITIICRNCYSKKKIPCKAGFGGAQLPRICEAVEQGTATMKKPRLDKCPVDPFIVLSDQSTYSDHQTLKLQEDPETIPTGEMPRQVLLSVERYLVGKAVPGTRVTILGIYTIMHSKKHGTASDVHPPYLRVLGLQVEGTGRFSSKFKPEEEQEFIRFSKQPNLYNQLADSIAPAVYGHEDIKRALLVQLFGGSRKVLPDGIRLRGDVNVLLLGDPGTAKSQMLKFIEKVAPIAVYTSGKGSSAAGLTASVVKDKSSREFYLEGGAMVLADGGIVCIDEFDKMRVQDRVAIHEAMEQQTISVAKAGITTILNSRTAVLAAANPVFGRYDDMKSASENIDFQSTILSRFDLIFLVKDQLSEEKDKLVVLKVLKNHMRVASDEKDISFNQLKRYVAYCRSKCSPRLSTSAAEILQNHYVSVRSAVRDREIEGMPSAIPITVRQLEAIVRISEALAKITLSSVATEQHVNEAIRLFKVSTFEAATSGAIQSETLTPQLLAEVQNAEKLLKRRLPIGSQISEKHVIDDFVKQGINEFAIRKAIQILVQRDELEYRNQRKRIYRRC